MTPPEPALQPSQPETAVAATLHAFAARLAAGDAEGAAALFTDDATYDETPAHSFVGRAALRAFISDFSTRHHEVSFSVTRLLVSSDGAEAAAEWRWAYTSDSDGQRRVFAGASFLTLRNGLIAAWRGYSTLMSTDS